MRCFKVLLLLYSQAAWANPAVWVAHGPQATVYLFGSVHFLRAGTEWQGPAVRRAFEAASECWFEVKPPENPAKLRALISHAGYDPSQRLYDLLTDAEYGKLIAVAQDAGLSQIGLDAMRPWLVLLRLEERLSIKAGYDPDLGADEVLLQQAKAAGKEVFGIEQDESHIHLFADLPQDLALQALKRLLDESAEWPVQIGQVIADWQAGQASTLVAKDFPENLAAFQEIVVAKRNAMFANTIENLLTGSKTILVTVGVGHLDGPGNVRESLKARGIAVERVPD